MKFLLVKLNHLGDTLLLTPAIRFLRERFPAAQIDVMVRRGCEVVLENNPDISRLIPIARPEKARRSLGGTLKESWTAFRQVAGQRYDYAFDLSDSDRAKFWVLLSGARQRGTNTAYYCNWKHRLVFNRFSEFKWAEAHQVMRDFQTVLDVSRLQGEPGPLRFFPRADDAAIAERLPWFCGLGAFAVIHPTSRWAFKQWLPERWAAVADALHEQHKLSIVFSCGPEERETEHVAQILAKARHRHFATEGRISLHELGRLLGQCKLFLGVDTVAMHLAAAMQAPTVALFGPSSEWSWHPWQCRHELVLGNCSCKQTRKFVCDKSKPYPCMVSISADQVTAAATRLLSAP